MRFFKLSIYFNYLPIIYPLEKKLWSFIWANLKTLCPNQLKSSQCLWRRFKKAGQCLLISIIAKSRLCNFHNAAISSQCKNVLALQFYKFYFLLSKNRRLTFGWWLKSSMHFQYLDNISSRKRKGPFFEKHKLNPFNPSMLCTCHSTCMFVTCVSRTSWKFSVTHAGRLKLDSNKTLLWVIFKLCNV